MQRAEHHSPASLHNPYGHYPAPPSMGQRYQHREVGGNTYAASSERFEGRLQEVLDITEIEVELTRENYKSKFHNLICWEEKRHIEILGSK